MTLLGFLRGFGGSDSILKRSQLPEIVLTDTEIKQIGRQFTQNYQCFVKLKSSFTYHIPYTDQFFI